MEPERWLKVKELFGAALDREPEERKVFLRAACGSDQELLAELQSLLDSYDSTLSGAGASAVVEAPAVSFVGRRLGAYQIQRELGRGGMATVVLASRADEVYRKLVAVKVLNQLLIGDEMLRRFRNERQTLAALDHPNVVRLLDGGTTVEGLPYLVMDYVEGVPIDQYCDHQCLSTNERLKLFCTVCAAVHYAHKNLVIHRDLKPDNILITSEGQPKLLDFGIAKLSNPAFAALTVATRENIHPMTPEYASPEQVRGDPLTVGTDVYSP